MSHIKLVFAALLVACALAQLTGCTVVGLTAGAITDASKHDEDTLHVMQVLNLKRGDEIAVVSGSDSNLRGEYLDMDETRTEQYIEKYRVWRLNNSDQLSLPSLDDSVVVIRGSPLRPNIEGLLLGFDPGIIYIRVGDDIERVGVESARTIAGKHGKAVEAKALKSLFQNRRVPFMSTMLIKSGADTLHIPLHELREIHVRNFKNSMLLGFVCGAVVDVIILTTFRIPMNITNR